MGDQDIKIKIKEVIEATILSIVQEQSEKIEKLEKLVEQQQERIEFLETKILTPGLPGQRKQMHHNTTNIPHQTNQHQEQKPDPATIKNQLKKLELEKAQDQKQRPASKPKTTSQVQQKNNANPNTNRSHATQNDVKQVQAKEAIKNLPEPKKIKTNTTDVQKSQQFSSTQPIKLNNQPKSHSSSTRELVGLKKCPSQANQLTIGLDQGIKSSHSPQIVQKSQFSNKQDDELAQQQQASPLKKQQTEEEDQLASDIQLESISNGQEYQESLPSNQQFENQETLQVQLEQLSSINREDGKLIQLDFKTMTIDSFAIIEMNFVNDLLSQQDVPDSIKLVIYTFLLIVEKIDQYNLEDENFWEKASKFLSENEKSFPNFLDSVKLKKFEQHHLDKIKNLIEENKDLIDPDKFEDIDALTCSLTYFIKDFYSGLQKIS